MKFIYSDMLALYFCVCRAKINFSPGQTKYFSHLQFIPEFVKNPSPTKPVFFLEQRKKPEETTEGFNHLS